jgi:hypothetical protein
VTSTLFSLGMSLQVQVPSRGTVTFHPRTTYEERDSGTINPPRHVKAIYGSDKILKTVVGRTVIEDGISQLGRFREKRVL